ncbi:MAG: LuxR C-terminal-related transcriptional regulator [Oscillospiraceae bacterium]
MKLVDSIRAALREYRPDARGGISLRIRLLSLLAVLVLFVALGFLLLLTAFGVFDRGETESAKLLQSEINNIEKNVSLDCGKLSMQGIALSQELSDGITRTLADHALTPADYKTHPEVLNDILFDEVGDMKASLKWAKSSGIFIILDSTVNSKAPNAETSRAGVYLRCTEPNIVNAIDATAKYLIGPSEISRSYSIQLLPQWRQEFDVTHFDFFSAMVENAKTSGLPLSRQYYWSKRISAGGSGEDGILLAVPIIAEDETVYGICGFEVSTMLFKLSYSPDNAVYPRIFATLSPSDDREINMTGGLIAGNYYMLSALTGENVTVTGASGSLTTFVNGSGVTLDGMVSDISLYPEGSLYSGDRWVTGVLVPESELLAQVSHTNRLLILLILSLMGISLAAAVFISHRFVKPIHSAFSGIKNNAYTKSDRTKIPEIDDLFEFLAEQDKQREALAQSLLEEKDAARKASVYEKFVTNISKLSAAEKKVFDLYLAGHTAQEISELLFISINTIKTHNKRIFEKLEVSSRKELMVYIQMMKELNPVV